MACFRRLSGEANPSKSRQYRVLAAIGSICLLLIVIYSLASVSNDMPHTQQKRQFQLGGVLGGYANKWFHGHNETQETKTDDQSLKKEEQNHDGGKISLDILGGLNGTGSYLVIDEQSTNQYEQTVVSGPASNYDSSIIFNSLSEAMKGAISLDDGQPRFKVRSLPSQDTSHQPQFWRNNSHMFDNLAAMVAQTSDIDTGASVRLLDSVLNALPVDNTQILSCIPQVANKHSISASQLIPMILPAIAQLLGQQMEPYKSSVPADMPVILNAVVAKGCLVIQHLVGNEACMVSSKLQSILNEIAGISCLAATNLNLSLCVLSQFFEGLLYRIRVPCLAFDAGIPAAPAQVVSDKPDDNHSTDKQSLTWSISTLTTTGDYVFSSMPGEATSNANANQPTDYAAPGYSQSAASASLPDQYNAPSLQTITSEPCVSTEAPVTQPPAYATSGPVPSTNCPCQVEASELASIPAYSRTLYNSVSSPCTHTGYPCDDCPGGWFCPPRETPAQSVACGLGWPCYHCSSGYYCISNQNDETSTKLSAPTLPVESIEPLQSTGPPSYSSSASSSQPGPPPAAPVPTVGSVSDDWLYLGCFQDSKDRVLQDSKPEDNLTGGMTNRQCTEHCRQKGYVFAGTENGAECWCGNSLRNESIQLPDSTCSMGCQNATSECCGGGWAISLYSCPQEPSHQYGSFASLLAAENTK